MLDIEAIRSRAEAATRGPWRVRVSIDDEETVHSVVQVERGQYFTIAYIKSWEHREQNASLIAHARTDVPALLAEVDRLRAVLANLIARVDPDDDPTRGVKWDDLDTALDEGRKALKGR